VPHPPAVLGRRVGLERLVEHVTDVLKEDALAPVRVVDPSEELGDRPVLVTQARQEADASALARHLVERGTLLLGECDTGDRDRSLNDDGVGLDGLGIGG